MVVVCLTKNISKDKVERFHSVLLGTPSYNWLGGVLCDVSDFSALLLELTVVLYY